MNRCPVSVVIATYQRAALLPETLRSVLAALEEGDEVIVVDDGSTDATRSVVCDARAPWRHVTRYIPRPHFGPGRAFNAGIEAATHDLVAFADSDDLWKPFRLAIQRPLMRDIPELAYCFTNFAHQAQDGIVTPRWLAHWSGDSRSFEQLLGRGEPYGQRWPVPSTVPLRERDFRVHTGSMWLHQLRANYMNVNTLIVRRSVAGKKLAFGVDLPRLADWECYARISSAGEGAYLDIDTAVQRAHGGPRLSHGGDVNFFVSRIAVIERTWARSATFMQAHGREVHEILDRLRREAAHLLIREGRRDEARALVAQLPRAWWERVALVLPPLLIAMLAAVYDAID